MPQHARNHHNENITIVQINPLTTDSIIPKQSITTTEKTIAESTTVVQVSEPRGFTSDDLKTSTEEPPIKTTVTEGRNLIKILIETTSETSSVFRVGKLQEKALTINHGLLEPHFRRKTSSKYLKQP